MSTRAAVSFFTVATWTNAAVTVFTVATRTNVPVAVQSTRFGISLVEVRARHDDGPLGTSRVCFSAHVACFATLVGELAVFAAAASRVQWSNQEGSVFCHA